VLHYEATRSTDEILKSKRSKEACSIDDTAVGNDGDVETSLYHVRTKSRTTMMSISLTADEKWRVTAG